MKSSETLRLLSGGSKGVVKFLCVTAIIGCLLLNGAAYANEIMTDRCSADVSFPPSYDEGPNAISSVTLTRKSSASTNWSLPFRVRTDSSGRIRWWCNSTIGNWLDPGTWRIDGFTVGSKCNDFDCEPTLSISIDTSDVDGWTAERSRCDSRSSLIRARLGPDRLLEIECLPDTGTTRQPLVEKDCSYGPETCARGFVWRGGSASDTVCVYPLVRVQVANDNRIAASRRDPILGADTCLSGFVWREAFPGDRVCVEPSARSQAWLDNANAYSRKACK